MKSSGRPAIQMGPTKKIASTFGSTPGAVLGLSATNGTFTLKVPEFALKGGYNILFEIGSASAKGPTPVVGSTVHLATQIADHLHWTPAQSEGPPFEIRVPLGGGQSINLAVGRIETNEQGQETGKVPKWEVYAPTRVDTGLGEAYFELGEIGPSYLYGTTAAPTVGGPPSAPPTP